MRAHLIQQTILVMLMVAAAMPKAAAAESEKQFKISATAPATNYKLSISGVYQVKKR